MHDAQVLDEQEKLRVLNSNNLQRSLRLVERVVEQTFYHAKHLSYRNLPKVVSMKQSLSLPQVRWLVALCDSSCFHVPVVVYMRWCRV